MLARMGLSLNIPHVKINHIRLLFENHRLDIKRPNCMSIIRRTHFDGMLCEAVKAAGIQVREDEAAERIRFDGEECFVETPASVYRARVVVGADGSKGLTHRLLPGFARFPGVGLTTDTPEHQSDGSDFREGRVTVDFTCNASGVPGYAWHFPFDDGERRGFNRGIYACSLNGPENHGNLISMLRESLESRGVGMDGRVLGGYGAGYYRGRRLSRPSLLLTGDAAGGNLFTGEGIVQALRYGQLAAEEIARAFSARDFSFRFYTARVAASDLGRELADAGRMAREFYTEGPALALPAMQADKKMRELVADYMAGVKSFRGIRRDLLGRMMATSIKCGAPGFSTVWRLFMRRLFGPKPK
jgi:flavin-dependent dehydrogenase